MEVWGGVSARAAFTCEPPAADKGLTRLTEGLAFTRWDAALPADVDNLVLLTGDEVPCFLPWFPRTGPCAVALCCSLMSFPSGSLWKSFES